LNDLLDGITIAVALRPAALARKYLSGGQSSGTVGRGAAKKFIDCVNQFGGRALRFQKNPIHA
jgi:hypothetical protein